MKSHADNAASDLANAEFCKVTAPLGPEAVWQIESLLLKVFEYGDYSFRSALSGQYHKTLNCTFFLAKHNGSLVGAAGCLHSHSKPAFAIVGPVCVDTSFRSRGIGTRLVESLMECLKLQGCAAVNLGVSQDSPAVNFYKRLGFNIYKGIVMRHLFCSEKGFEGFFSRNNHTQIRRADWGDFPSVQVLASTPADLYTFDFKRGIFSAKYLEPTRFLSLFPEMMRSFTKYGGFANVLISGREETIVGITHINKLPGAAQRHIAELDFFVHDNFIDRALSLVKQTIEESASLSIKSINCYCLACDHRKKEIFTSAGAVQIATLPDNVRIKGNLVDVLVYQIRGANVV
jgi:GNAT superfamily N-acetyltransferase/RimJ/RimL family protein N-acetyltransferase